MAPLLGALALARLSPHSLTKNYEDISIVFVATTKVGSYVWDLRYYRQTDTQTDILNL